VYCTHKTQKHKKNFKTTTEPTLTQTNCPRGEIDTKTDRKLNLCSSSLIYRL